MWLPFGVSALADASNERSFSFQHSQYQTSPSTPVVYPGTDFSMKSMPSLVPALRLQTSTCLLGLRTYLFPFLSSSSSLSLLFVPPFKSSQAWASLCLFSLSPFKSRQVGANSLAVFLSFLSTFFGFSLASSSLSNPLSLSICMFLQILLREFLDLACWRREVSFGIF